MTQTISNADIMREIKGITKVTDDHERRIKDIEHYKTTQEAVAEYVSKFGTPAQKASNGSQENKPNLLASTIIKLFALFTVIIGLITIVIREIK